MSEILENVDIKPEAADISNGGLQEYSNLIKQKALFYREENSKMEDIFGKLKLLNDELRLLGLESSAKKIITIMSNVETRHLSSEQTILAQAERVKNQYNYEAKLQICIRHYGSLSQKISEDIKVLRSAVGQSKNISNKIILSTSDIQQLEEKAKKYDNELTKIEKKYPWLRNPDYDLPHISELIETCNALRKERDSLVNELSSYKNLKPDVKEARQQLSELKDQIKRDMITFKM